MPHLSKKIRSKLNAPPHTTYFSPGLYTLSNAISEVLHNQPHFLCEIEDKKGLEESEKERNTFVNSGCDLELALFAVNCYRNSVAHDITNALAAHYNMDGLLKNNIHLCLHEAIINGVIHGNLSVPGVFKTKEALGDYYEWIEARLAVPALCYSRIQILSTYKNHRFLIEVIDQGRGYRFDDYLGPEATLKLHQGLSLIRMSCDSMKILGNGNHIQMEFAAH